MQALDSIRTQVISHWKELNILQEKIIVSAKPLTPEEAIGTPDDTDYPIQQGKEYLMEATFNGHKGQAFTGNRGTFSGTLADIAALPLTNDLNRAVFIATLNAVGSAYDNTTNTIHCKDNEPKQCAQQLHEFIQQKYGKCRITIIGFQPAMAEALQAGFEVRLIDLDPKNIGQVKRGVLIEGKEKTDDAVQWADLLLVTGTTLANNSIDLFLTEKPVIFYGTTIAGAAPYMNWERFCPMSK
ncbi:Rossmann-like domain-containing protein [Halodesulfovibrio aestuarii]|uniref:Rossmann-like domain-containing protein n=1 Tax=Halodesulfovibrio aestuarii TaxID=126333 RepID=UPI003D332B85